MTATNPASGGLPAWVPKAVARRRSEAALLIRAWASRENPFLIQPRDLTYHDRKNGGVSAAYPSRTEYSLAGYHERFLFARAM